MSAYHHPHNTCKCLETTTHYKRCSQRAHTLMGIKLTRRNKALPTQNTFYEDSETSLANQRNETRKRETERVKGPPNARTGSKTLHNCLKLRRASHQVFHRRGACNIKIATRSTKPSRFGEHPWTALISSAKARSKLWVTGNTFFREDLGLFCRVYVEKACLRDTTHIFCFSEKLA